MIEVLHVLRRLLSVLALPPLEADIVHGTAAGVSSLLGVVTKARKGTRFVLTEHGVFVREAFIAQAKPSVSSAVRHLLGRFAVGTAMAAFRSADEVLPVAEFNKRWEVALATDPAKIRRLQRRRPGHAPPVTLAVTASFPLTALLGVWAGPAVFLAIYPVGIALTRVVTSRAVGDGAYSFYRAAF